LCPQRTARIFDAMIISVSSSSADRFLRESFAPVLVVSLFCHVLFLAGIVGLTKAVYKSREYERPRTFDLVKLSQIFEVPPEPKMAALPKLKTAAARTVAPAPAASPPKAAPVEETKLVPSEQKTAAQAEPRPQPATAEPQVVIQGAPDAQVSTDKVYEEGMVDEPPVAIKKPQAFYPPFVEDQGIQGIVRAQVTIDEKGNVIEIKILSSPHELLTDEVMKAVSRWKYKPGKFKGVAVKVKNRPIEIQFKLD
jgi:protein TonB